MKSFLVITESYHGISLGDEGIGIDNLTPIPSRPNDEN